MHIVLSWDIKAPQPRWKEINDQLKLALKPHSWVRPLSTFYIVKIKSDSERVALKDRLKEVAKATPEKVHFVISPAMVGGQYIGWLPRDTWAKINQRSRV